MTEEERNNAIRVLKNFDLNNPKVNSLLFSAEEITNAFDNTVKALEQIPKLKEAYQKGYKDGQEALTLHYELCKEEGNIITVPDGATNGDMIKAMFPNANITVNEKLGEKGTVFVDFNEPDTVIIFDLEWWNSPYGKEQE